MRLKRANDSRMRQGIKADGKVDKCPGAGGRRFRELGSLASIGFFKAVASKTCTSLAEVFRRLVGGWLHLCFVGLYAAWWFIGGHIFNWVTVGESHFCCHMKVPQKLCPYQALMLPRFQVRSDVL